MAKKKKKQLDIAKEFENAVYVPLETRQQVEEERKKQREQQSRLFDGGSGSIGTKVKNTAADISLNILKGGIGATEGVSDFMRRRGASVLDRLGWDDKAEQLRNTANQNTTEGIASDFEHILYGDLSGSKKDEDIDVYEKMHEKSALTDRSRGIAQSVGYSVTNAAMSTAMGGGNVGSLILTGVSAGGSAESRAIEQGMDEDDAFIYGVLSGAGEAASEAFFGGVGRFTKALGYGKGALDDVLIENVTKRIGSNVLRSLTSFGLRAGGEGFEEILSAAFDTAAQKISGMDERSLAEIWQDQNVGQAFTDGVISSMFSSSPRLVSSIATGTNYDNGTTRNEQKVIEDIIDQRTQGRELSNKERGDLRQQITKDLIDGKIAGSEIDRALQNTETTWNQKKDKYITRTVINENTKFTTTDDDLKIDKKQLNKNANLEDVQNKIKVLEQDFLNANNDVRNTTSSHELFDEMKRMIVATGEQQRLTSNKQMAEDGALKLLTNKKGEPIRNGRGELQYVKADTGQLVTINGYHTKDGMVLNADTHKIFETTMGHELGESIKANTPEIYKALRKAAIAVGKADGTYTKETFEAIKATYGELGTNTDNYFDEYVNDKIGELFKSNSNMFNEIGKKPNVVRNLIDEIKYLIKKFTAGSPEQKRLIETQHNLEKILKQSVRELNVNQKQKTDNIQKQTTEDIAPIKEQVKEKPKQEIKKEQKEKNDNIIPTKTDVDNVQNVKKIKEKYDAANKESGNKKTIVLSDGQKLTGVYKLVESGKVTPSHDSNNFTKSINFPTTEEGTTINDRDYENDKNAQQLVKDKAQNYDGRAFNDNGVIVTKDGIVVSGNDRTMAGEIAARNNTDQAYIDYLKENANQFGFTEEQINSMQHPRVVLELENNLNYDTNTFAKFNKDSKKSKSISEKAKEIKKTVDQDTIQKISDVLNDYEKIDDVYNSTKASKQLLDLMVNKNIIDTNDIAELYDGSKFTGAGKDLVEATVLGSVVSEDNLKYFRNNNDLKFKLMKSAPAIIQNKTLGDYSILDEINKAIETYKLAQQSDMTVEQLNNQTSLFGDSDFDLITKRIAETLETKGFRNFLNFIEKYNYEAQAPANGQVDIFSGEIPSKESVLKNALNIDENTPLVRYSLSQDNQGRQLSEQQQDYFKDSKVRDSEGNLLTMYHGSQNDFTIFSRTFGGWYGDGYYFTDSKESGIDYAKGLRDDKGKLYETYLDIKNPYIPLGDTVNEDSSVTFAPSFREQFENTFKDDLPSNWNELGTTEQEHLIQKILKKNGYDGINNGDVWVAFESNQIKRVDNTSPTSNPDIRYSLSESKQTTDSNGKELSKEQLDYFKDSKILDDEGRLLEVYHGTPSQDKFTVFDPNRAGENTLSGEYGLYFTDSKEFADDFSYERLESGSMFFDIKGEKGNVYTNYLNVTNPLDFAKLTKEDISDLYDYASYIGQLDGKERFVENMLNWQQIGNHQLMKQNIDLKSIADNSKYDGVIAKLNVQGNENEYIVFNPNQIKNADNLNPTKDHDIRYSLSEAPKQDNQNRELTVEQQEFYKDSKARDDEGNLLTLYHGSNSIFTIFDITKSGESSKEAKIGFWFTPNKKGAENFANEVWYGDKTPTTYEVYLNIKNPKIYETYEVDQQQRDNMLQNMKNLEQEIRDSSHKYSWTETGDYKITSLYNDLVEMNRREINGIKFKEDAQYNEDFYRKLAEERNISTEKFNEMNQDAKNQVELETQNKKARDDYHSYVFSDAYEQFRTELYLSAGMSAEDANVGGMGMMIKNENEAVENFVNGLKQEGYDGIIIKNTHYDNESLGEGKNNDQYVAFYPEQIKNVDNKAPTSNPDIRYSLSQKVDSELDPLTDEQYEHFKNTKAVNQNGELELVHHGTPNQFNIFDISKAGANQFMDGFYFTNAIATARAFTGNEGGLYSTENDGVLDGYVNIEHPINRNGKDITFEQLKEMYDRLKNNPEYDDGEGMGWTLFDDVLSNYGDVNQMGIDNLLRTFYDSYDTDEVMVENMLSREKKDILYSTLRDVTGIDGEIIENPTGHDAFEKYFIAFNPDQFKLKDNKTPTDNVDMNLSLSSPDDIAPFGEGIKSEQIKPRDIQQTIQNSVQEAIAPIREQIQQIADEVLKSEDLSDLELNLEPFMDMINGDNGQVLSNINQNYDQIMTNLQEQGLPKDAAQSFLQNMVYKYDQAFNKVKQKMSEKDVTKIQKMILDAQEKFTNRNAYVDKLAKDSGNEMIKYKGDLANNSFGQAQYNVQTAQTNLNGEVIGKGVNEIFSQAKKQKLDAAFEDYLFNKSNIERHAVGKGSQVPSAVSEQLVRDYEASNPEFKTWSKDIETYYDNLLNLEVQSGLIDQDTYNLLRGENGLYRSYVPFYPSDAEKRYFDDAGDLKPIKTLKRAEGGANRSKIMGIQDAMTKQTMAVWNSMRTNQLYQEIINTLGGEEGLGFIVRNDPSNLSQSLYTDQDGNKFLTAYVNGQEMSTKISDELYNELSKKSENAIKEFEDKYSLLTKPLQGLSSFRRNVLTSWNPTFALFKNPVKDIQDAVLYSKHTAQMLKGLLPSYYQLLTNKTKEAKQFRALYGGGEYSGIGKGYARVSDMIELAPRFAEFKASLKAGESVEQALYNARDITTNFGRGGYVTKAMNRNGFTFLNASVQGFSKFYRNFAEQPNAGQFAMAVGKAAMLGIVPALINELAFGSGDDKDEDYEALPDYIKDNYYLFKKRDGDFIRVPKGRALSVMGSAARRTLERIEGEEDAFDGYLSNAWSQIGPAEIGGNPLDNTIVAPIAQVLGGEKGSGGNTAGRAWYGGDIVPYRLQGERPEDQSDASVDKMSIWLGEKFGISPYKVNYVIDQYTGGLGDLVLPMITEETKSGAETPLEYAIAPIKDQVVVNSIDDNKYASEFYSTKEKLYTGSKATDKDLLKAQYMDDVSFDLSELYKEKRAIQSDSSLDKKEKYKKVQQVQKQINEIAKEGLDKYEDITLTDNYASVGDDRAYYKNTKGKWTAIKEDELNTIETLGLTDSEKSSYFDVKNKIYNLDNDYKTKKEGKSEAEQIKLGIQQKKDRIETIKSSTLPDRAKYAMFDTKYDDKLLPYYEDLGFKANDIMTYKSQTFNADKDEYGDSISGSKKTKVLDYINSMNIPYEQKLILWKKEYKTDNTYDRQIVSYIDSHISDYSSKKAILEELGYEVNGNDIISANIAKKIRKKNNKK